jgi:hypothetical protein
VSVVDAVKARRAALAPKPRYELAPCRTILDRHTGDLLTVIEAVALLNEKEAAK